MIERLQKKFGVNTPIFTNEILEEMKDYSRPRVFQMLKKAESSGEIIKFQKGVYYIPTYTRYGKSLISVEQVIRKKYISNDKEVYGIYSGLQIQQRFLLTTQIPTAIEIITNNESTWIREIKVKNRNIILRKSRLPISKENVDAYTILELFSNIDLKNYLSNLSVQREVVNFIRNKAIKCKDVFTLSRVFPSKAIRNIMESGIINELT